VSALRAIAAGVALLGVALPGAAADLRRVESVGVVAIREGEPRPTAPRDAAVRAAVARAVEGVARGLLPDGPPAFVDPPDAAGSATSSELDPAYASALGEDPFEYATRFRILENRGTRPALLSRDSDVETEYVVVVEVFVDASRVRERLQASGWIAGPGGQAHPSVQLVVEGLTSYGAYRAVRETLLDDLDVESAVPLELSEGRAVLEVVGPYGVESLLTALVEARRPGLRLVPLDRDVQRLTVLVEWVAPPPAQRVPDPDGSDFGDGLDAN